MQSKKKLLKFGMLLAIIRFNGLMFSLMLQQVLQSYISNSDLHSTWRSVIKNIFSNVYLFNLFELIVLSFIFVTLK